MADKLIPKQALDYIKNKSLHPAFSYKDVWNEEHATAFTVAKAMQLDVLSDIKTAVEKAIENGTTFEQFKKELKPTLIQKGWWGKREMTDPLTGEIVNAQLGSDRRLKTIYQTNLRSAYQKGQYDRTMASEAHPYLMYRIGASVHHREQHLKWNNLILPKDDPLWNSIFPPNGYGCKCYTVAVTQARKEKYERDGVPAYNPDTQKTVRQPVQTVAPKPEYHTYFNERKGSLERIPKGITPGFNWNQGLPRDKQMEHALREKMEAQKKYLMQSGSSAGGIFDKSSEEQERYAKRAYEEIRKKNAESDIEKVSKSSGLSKEAVAKVRNHLFIAKHNLEKGFVRFDESAEIANAWEAMEQGRPSDLDIMLIKHELEELTIMEKFGYDYSIAHLLANKKYPWEYKRKGGYTDDDIQASIKERLETLLQSRGS